MGALSDYQFQVQDLLHDPLAQMWPVTSITSYINEARRKVAQDTKALRTVLTNAVFPTLVFSQGTEFISPQAFLPAPFGSKLVATMGITIIVNQQRQSLIQKAYTWVNANMRSWVNYQQWPTVWAQVSPTQICIAPIPNIDYPCEWDVSLNPDPLLQDTDTETIPAPFTDSVQYYAAYKAKLKQQSQGEAQMFLGMYKQDLFDRARGYQQRIIQNPYQSP